VIAGGVGEHGRNCFYVENGSISFILDCGIMAGTDAPFPYLSGEQIKQAQYLFISHSHKDHTGAYGWLIENGFCGQVILSEETFKQLEFHMKDTIFIDELAEPLKQIFFEDGLKVTWGHAGHCLGSVWYLVEIHGKTLLYTGDYIEDTLVYRVDPIRGISADQVIIDAAYGENQTTPMEYRTSLFKAISDLLTVTDTILLPVPKYGRNLELLLFLAQDFPDVSFYGDTFLIKELERFWEAKAWLKPEGLSNLQKISESIKPIKNGVKGFLFLSDPQLKQESCHKTAINVLSDNGKIVLTGGTDTGSFSKNLLNGNEAVLCRYAVHQNNQDVETLKRENNFKEIIPFHQSLPPSRCNISKSVFNYTTLEKQGSKSK